MRSLFYVISALVITVVLAMVMSPPTAVDLSPFTVDGDGDGFAAYTCGTWENPCPSNDVFVLDPLYEEDMDDADAQVGALCADLSHAECLAFIDTFNEA